MPKLLIFLSVLFGMAACAVHSEEEPDKIGVHRQVSGGEIVGEYADESDLFIFRGIPFAAPPVGDLRWKEPQPVVPWEGARECKAFGPSPMQPAPRPFMFWSSEFLIPEEPISEDCLYLNVWTPAKEESEKLPVLVYIYGGGFQSGGSACPIYDGSSMAGKNLVFVSINYRVGKFGFFAHPELSDESPSGTSGNYGILDMIAALQWVQNNIHSFGGNAGNVTIAGQSAGSFAVNYLAASPVAKGLFHRAIGESGASFYSNPRRPAVTPEEAENLGVEFAASAGAPSLAALREMPADSILAMPGGLTWPYTDGYVLPNSIHDIYQAGNQNDVPLLIGWNENDILMGPPMEEKAFRKSVSLRFGDLTETFNQAYPADSPEEIDKIQFEMNRDESFGVQVRAWGTLQSKTGEAPVYMYNFNRELPAHTSETQFGAFHSGEIVYAYDNLETLDRPWEEADREIARIMSGYWANFASSGDPNGGGLPEWRPYKPDQEFVQVIDTEIQSVTLPTRQKLMFWEQFLTRDQEE